MSVEEKSENKKILDLHSNEVVLGCIIVTKYIWRDSGGGFCTKDSYCIQCGSPRQTPRENSGVLGYKHPQ